MLQMKSGVLPDFSVQHLIFIRAEPYSSLSVKVHVLSLWQQYSVKVDVATDVLEC